MTVGDYETSNKNQYKPNRLSNKVCPYSYPESFWTFFLIIEEKVR